MGFNTHGISLKTRFKRRLSTSGPPSSSGLNKVPLDMDQKRMKCADHRRLSPTAAPFNSTSFLIRQKSQQRENEKAPGAFDEFGSNVGNMISCCPCCLFTHNRDRRHQSQAQRLIVKGMPNLDSEDDVSLMHSQFQGLRVTDSGSDMEVDDSPTVHDSGDSTFEHRRVRSVTDDNFEMLGSSNVQYSWDADF